MSPVRIAILCTASFAGLACVGLLAHSMAAGKERARVMTVAAPAQAPAAPMKQVLVARHDLSVGDRLDIADMNWQPWPAAAVVPSFITDGSAAVQPQTQTGKIVNTVTTGAISVTKAMTGPSADGPMANLVGAIVRQPMLMGEPIIASKLVRADSAGVMAVTLDPGMRAMAVPLSAESAAGGFILPGDHVDIVQSRQVDTSGAKRFTTATILENVRVLAIDQNTKPQKSAATAVGATATVEVTPLQSEYLAAAKAQGDLTLTLRSYADASGGSRAGPGATTTPASVVRVFRNGAMTEVKVAR
jgi:pilus assembly protein CpaB